MGGGLFRTQSLFEDNDFFSTNRTGFSGMRANSFGADFHNNDLDSHPGLSKSISMTTRTM
jgi:hypothetical protein